MWGARRISETGRWQRTCRMRDVGQLRADYMRFPHDAMQASHEKGAAMQVMSRDGRSLSNGNGLSKWSSVRNRVLQLSSPSGSGNSDAAALHASAPISRYETSYPNSAGRPLCLNCRRSIDPHSYLFCTASLIKAAICEFQVVGSGQDQRGSESTRRAV